MKRIFAIAVLALCGLTAQAQFWTVDNNHWLSSGVHSNYGVLGVPGALTNWCPIYSANGPVIIDSAFIQSGTPPYTLRLFKSIGSTIILATNLATIRDDAATNLIVAETNSAWNGKWALIYHRSNGLYIRVKTELSGPTNFVPPYRKGMTVQTNQDFQGGTSFGQNYPTSGDRIWIMDEVAAINLHTNTTTMLGVTGTAGGIRCEVPLGIPIGTDTGEQVIMAEWSCAVAGAYGAATTNKIQLMKGRFLK